MFIDITYKATNNGHLYFRRSVILYVNFDMAELAIRTKSPFNYFDTLKCTLCKTLLLLTVSSRLEDSLTHYIYRLWAVKYEFTSSTITHYYYYLADCYFTIDEGIKKNYIATQNFRSYCWGNHIFDFSKLCTIADVRKSYANGCDVTSLNADITIFHSTCNW